jgi:hypothetical protein
MRQSQGRYTIQPDKGFIVEIQTQRRCPIGVVGGDREGGEGRETDERARGEGGEFTVGEGEGGEVGERAKVVGAQVGLQVEALRAGQLESVRRRWELMSSLLEGKELFIFLPTVFLNHRGYTAT